jgi:hypothetical protein
MSDISETTQGGDTAMGQRPHGNKPGKNDKSKGKKKKR